MDNSAEKIENTEVTPATEETSTPMLDQPSLGEAIKESQDAILNAEPVKRRGRPKKDPNAPAKEKSKKAAEPEKPATAAISTPPPIYLKPVINFPYQALAVKTGWPGWNLSDKEQEDNAVLLDACIKRYLPDFSNNHPEAFALAFSLGMATLTRYFTFQALLAQAQATAQAGAATGSETIPQNNQPAAQLRPITVERPNKKTKKETDPTIKPASPMSDFLNHGPQNSPQI